MARKQSGGQVTLRGRFAPGDVVTLVKVAGPHVLRSEGGEEIETKEVEEQEDQPRVGCVSFSRRGAGRALFRPGGHVGSAARGAGDGPRGR